MPTSVCVGEKPRARSAEAVSAFDVKTRPACRRISASPMLLVVHAPESAGIALCAAGDQVVHVRNAERTSPGCGSESCAVGGEVTRGNGDVGPRE